MQGAAAGVDDTTLEEIRSLASNGANMDIVAGQIQKKARLAPDLIKYIARTNFLDPQKHDLEFILQIIGLLLDLVSFSIEREHFLPASFL